MAVKFIIILVDSIVFLCLCVSMPEKFLLAYLRVMTTLFGYDGGFLTLGLSLNYQFYLAELVPYWLSGYRPSGRNR
jgi:hypothetical protein